MKKIVWIIVGAVLIIGMSVGVFFYFQKPTIIFEKELSVSIFEERTNFSFVSDFKEVTLLTKEEMVDTSTLGKQTLTFVYKNKFGKKFSSSCTIEVVDQEEPVITFKDLLETEEGTKIDLLKDVKVEDNSKEELEVKVEGEYDFSKVGEYKLSYVAEDSSGNTKKEEFTLKVNAKKVVQTSTLTTIIKAPDRTFTTSKGFKGEVKNGVTYIDGILVANKTYSLPSNYGSGLTNTTLTAFEKMKNAAKDENLNIYISSGFRSYSKQNTIYNNYVARDGVKNADTYSARPGYSEHQSGLAFDVNTISSAFDNTKEAKWLASNCYKYGFILRYPKGKTNETGYIYESWHFRYVGEELASKLYNNGDWITLESYFGITSQYAN